MVRCVVVETEKIEETRRYLASKNLIDDRWKIETSNSNGYIPVVEDAELSDYKTANRKLDERENYETVSEILGYNPTYEWLGDIILLKEDDKIDKIVNAFNQSKHEPRSILRKCSDIKGEERTRDWEIVFGSETETIHKENGYEYLVDVTEAYFSPRLATDRRRVCSQIQEHDKVVDMFAGVGPYAIPSADRGATVVASDINPSAIDYLRRNAERNDVADNIKALNVDARELVNDYKNYADVIIMNLPHSTSQFMETAVHLLADDGRIVYYGFLSNDKSAEDLERYLRDNTEGDLTDDIVVDELERVRPYAPDVDNIRADIRVHTTKQI